LKTELTLNELLEKRAPIMEVLGNLGNIKTAELDEHAFGSDIIKSQGLEDIEEVLWDYYDYLTKQMLELDLEQCTPPQFPLYLKGKLVEMTLTTMNDLITVATLRNQRTIKPVFPQGEIATDQLRAVLMTIFEKFDTENCVLESFTFSDFAKLRDFFYT
jgi:hypothetical protein